MPTISSEAKWPFKFVAEITEEDNMFCSYEPRSDFSFLLDDCPSISIEVCSDPRTERDPYRLLLLAGLLVRTINAIKTEGSSFVAFAIYISHELSAKWYLVYQPERARQDVEITNS